MGLTYHPLVKRDIVEALKFYRDISSPLADEFFGELWSTIDQIAVKPHRFHSVDRGFRRANLNRFPYHILYETISENVRIMHVRHNKRHPDYGSHRR